MLQHQQYAKALETSSMVHELLPENKHARALLATAQQKTGKKKAAGVTVTELCTDFQKVGSSEDALDLGPPNEDALDLGPPLELTVSLLVEMHRTRRAEAPQVAPPQSRVRPEAAAHLLRIARLYVKHGLDKDALVAKLPSLCNCCPTGGRGSAQVHGGVHARCGRATAAEGARDGPQGFTNVLHITEVMCKLPSGAHGSAAGARRQALRQARTPDHPEDLRVIVEDLRASRRRKSPINERPVADCDRAAADCLLLHARPVAREHGGVEMPAS